MASGARAAAPLGAEASGTKARSAERATSLGVMRKRGADAARGSIATDAGVAATAAAPPLATAVEGLATATAT